MERVEVAVIGTGWCGGIRAETLVALRTGRQAAYMRDPARPPGRGQGADQARHARPSTIRISSTTRILPSSTSAPHPSRTHFPIARDCLRAGKHVLLEKPIALELWEADELIALARRGNAQVHHRLFAALQHQDSPTPRRRSPTARLGKPSSSWSAAISRRSLGKKIASRVKLSPAAMESTHDLDFVFWLLEPAKPVRVYSQGAYGYMQPVNGSYDYVVHRDHGQRRAGRHRRRLEPAAELSELLLHLDRDHRHGRGADPRRHPARHWLNTVAEGTRFPMSTMPGEQVDHVFAGQMGPETIHFLESVLLDRPVMVTPESARTVMEAYTAADLSAERNEPIDLPLSNESLSAVAEMAAAQG